jgi:pimeloyl-ACP methyl ester carboxylesterase
MDTTYRMDEVVEDYRGGSVSLRIAGAGEPGLIWVHGFCGHKGEWVGQEAQFAPQSRCVMIDMPGHGSSQVPVSTRVEHIAGIVNEIAARHGVARNVLIGHSMGTRVVLEAYSQAPSSVAGIILIDPSYMAKAPGHVPADRSIGPVPGSRQMLRKLFPEMFVATSDPKLVARSMERVEAVDEDYATGTFANFLGWDMEKHPAVLGSIRVPLMVIQSTYLDPEFKRRSITDPNDSPYIGFALRHAPHAEINIVTGVGHYPHLEKPADVNAMIGRFVTEGLG